MTKNKGTTIKTNHVKMQHSYIQHQQTIGERKIICFDVFSFKVNPLGFKKMYVQKKQMIIKFYDKINSNEDANKNTLKIPRMMVKKTCLSSTLLSMNKKMFDR